MIKLKFSFSQAVLPHDWQRLLHPLENLGFHSQCRRQARLFDRRSPLKKFQNQRFYLLMKKALVGSFFEIGCWLETIFRRQWHCKLCVSSCLWSSHRPIQVTFINWQIQFPFFSIDRFKYLFIILPLYFPWLTQCILQVSLHHAWDCRPPCNHTALHFLDRSGAKRTQNSHFSKNRMISFHPIISWASLALLPVFGSPTSFLSSTTPPYQRRLKFHLSQKCWFGIQCAGCGYFSTFLQWNRCWCYRWTI